MQDRIEHTEIPLLHIPATATLTPAYPDKRPHMPGPFRLAWLKGELDYCRSYLREQLQPENAA